MNRSKSINELFKWDFEVNKQYHCGDCGNMTPIGENKCRKCLDKPIDLSIYDSENDETMYELVGGYYTDIDVDLSVPRNCYTCNKFCGTDDRKCDACKRQCSNNKVRMCIMALLVLYGYLYIIALFAWKNKNDLI